MADYAVLLRDFKSQLGIDNIPTVGFGGSYGGMVRSAKPYVKVQKSCLLDLLTNIRPICMIQIAAWFKRKYPTLVDGVISASAPIWSFVNMTPPYDYDGGQWPHVLSFYLSLSFLANHNLPFSFSHSSSSLFSLFPRLLQDCDCRCVLRRRSQ